MSIIKPKVTIYTDGACSGNPGPGGWGAYLEYKDVKKEIFGYQLNTTSNQMELLAAIEALNCLKKSCIIDLYTDSKYLQLGITKWINGWKANSWRKSDNKPLKNIELWQKLDQQIVKHDVSWYWVKGHADNYGNILADKLAVLGSQVARKEQNVICK